jgi:hypothetical protein
MKPQDEKDGPDLFGAIEPEQPSMRFTKNVMDAIESESVAPIGRKYVNLWVVKGIAAILVLAVVVLTAYTYITADSIPASAKSFTLSDSYSPYIIMISIIMVVLFAERLLNTRQRMQQIRKTSPRV